MGWSKMERFYEVKEIKAFICQSQTWGVHGLKGCGLHAHKNPITWSIVALLSVVVNTLQGDWWEYEGSASASCDTSQEHKAKAAT